MNRHEHYARMVVAGLLIAALVVPMVAVGCASGDGESQTATTAATASGGENAVGADGTTTSSAIIDALSSFKSKDPFIPQAQATTTTPTTAPPVTTTVTTPTTLPVTTTTAPHRLQVTAIPGGAGTVSFTLDGNNLSGFGAGPALFTGPWGSIQILDVNDSVPPYTASFRRDGSIDFTLQVNQYQTW